LPVGKFYGFFPPITPTERPLLKFSSEQEAKVYHFIAMHFLASISYDIIQQKKTVVFRHGNDSFTLTGASFIEEGFSKVMPSLKLKSIYIEDYLEGESYEVASVQLLEEQTQPPRYLTEKDIMDEMEKHGLASYDVIEEFIGSNSGSKYAKF
jgi:DNA topoisomerase IA